MMVLLLQAAMVSLKTFSASSRLLVAEIPAMVHAKR
jgi:hypothetical protein